MNKLFSTLNEEKLGMYNYLRRTPFTTTRRVEWRSSIAIREVCQNKSWKDRVDAINQSCRLEGERERDLTERPKNQIKTQILDMV